jgi:hypothetical protein
MGCDCLGYEGAEMSKLIEQLRSVCETGCHPDLPFDAADRIEHLERVLRETRDLISAVDACSRNNFSQLAAEQVDAIDEAFKS